MKDMKPQALKEVLCQTLKCNWCQFKKLAAEVAVKTPLSELLVGRSKL